MGFSAVFPQEALEDVADTPCVEVSSIRTIEVDTIISFPSWMAINVLLEFLWKGVVANRDLGFYITFLQFIYQDLIPYLASFGLSCVGSTDSGSNLGGQSRMRTFSIPGFLRIILRAAEIIFWKAT